MTSKPTQVFLPASAIQPSLRKPHDFKLGDKVRLKDNHNMSGIVVHVPDPDLPIVKIATHVLGNEMGVDLDMGGLAVSDVDKWEPDDN